MTRTARALLLSLAAGALVAGCSSNSTTSTTTARPSGTGTTAGTTAGTAPATAPKVTGAPATTAPPTTGTITVVPTSKPAGAATTIMTGKVDVGTVVVNGAGATLYILTKDTPTSSACNSACASAWPPMLAGSATAGAGLDASKVGTLTRDDGTVQITYGGHPLYSYKGDEKPGDATGQAAAGTWFVVGADGNPIK